MLYQMQFLPPLDSTLSERDIDNAKSNNQIKEKFITHFFSLIWLEFQVLAKEWYCLCQPNLFLSSNF